MKNIFSFLILITLASCVQSQSSDMKTQIPIGDKTPKANEAVATFGEGCFWHTEIVFQSLKGVRDAVSGYAGGTTVNPDYETVCNGRTGHAEVVQVYYDPKVISFQTLVQAFFASHNPTTLNRQGNDVGEQYRSVAFYRNANEKATIVAEIEKVKQSGKYANKIVTQVVPFTKFYPAEEYHQEYIYNHPDNGYVQNVSIPDYLEFRKKFKADYK
jgi:peptide-methionine (S)-S-oxide reductase